MKRLLAISILFIYTLGVTGVGVTSHFCCGRQASFQIVYAFSIFPDNPSPHGISGCCGKETRFFKVHDAQQQSANFIEIKSPQLSTPLVPFGFDRLLAIQQSSLPNSFYNLHAPPLLRITTPLFIRYSDFRI